MAEEKKSFLLYADIIHTVRKMPKDKVGELFLTILAYVNDEDPVVDDILVDLVFEPIKWQLKRDLKKWEKFIKRQSDNGKLGGRPKKPTEFPINPENPSLYLESQKSLNVTVNVNDNVKEEQEEIPAPKNAESYLDDKILSMIVPEMLKTWLRHKPKYYITDDYDKPACLRIAYLIADVKGWKHADVVEGKEKECLASWDKIAKFIVNNSFFSKLTLDSIANQKQWQKITNDMIEQMNGQSGLVKEQPKPRLSFK